MKDNNVEKYLWGLRNCLLGYDDNGNEIEADTPEGDIHYAYDPTTNQHIETYTDNSDIVYGYDDQGRLTTVTVEKLNGQTLATPLVTTYGYDAVGNKISEVLRGPSGIETDYTYNAANQLTNLVEKKGATTLFSETYVLNDDGTRHIAHEVQSQPDNSTITTDSTWTYDADGRLTEEAVISSVSS